MKRMIAVLLSVMALAGVLTACSGTAAYGDGYGYGNVSTTPNGYVNGTNGYNYGANGYGTNGYGGGYGYANGSSGTVNNGTTTNGTGTNGTVRNGTTTNGTGYANGTGMTGGR
ncbi:MAG: hypothetical protein ACI4PT_00650 [Candidatus Avoscillospira sp.]